MFRSRTRDEMRALIGQAVEKFGRIDCLFNNAGGPAQTGGIEGLDVERFDAAMATLLRSVMLGMKHAAPIMKRQGGGKIINIGSMMSLFGASFAPAYAASKGGIVQFTKACASAWALDNIQVNAVLPGWIDTELTQRARREVEGLHDNVLRRTPAKRWGTGADMAGVAVFLASPASDFVTGSAIPVDGGYSIQG